MIHRLCRCIRVFAQQRGQWRRSYNEEEIRLIANSEPLVRVRRLMQLRGGRWGTQHVRMALFVLIMRLFATFGHLSPSL